MNITPISFGKAIKVDAPKVVAEKFIGEKQINKKEDPALLKFAHKIFGSNEDYENNIIYEIGKNESYIFTGEDAWIAEATVESIIPSDSKRTNKNWYNSLLREAFAISEDKGEISVDYEEHQDEIKIKKAKFEKETTFEDETFYEIFKYVES